MLYIPNYRASEKDRWTKEASRGNERSEFERDRDRLIHSAAFRRLQGKTQVFGQGTSDFFRTRLTHSLEAAQIGKGLALLTQKSDPDLVEFACLAHDIGHPPFGHVGEDILKELMENHGGFEGNAQNLRILHQLEVKSEAFKGLNLTRASIDAIIKYPTSYSVIRREERKKKDWKFYYDADEKLVEWAKQGCPKDKRQSFECQIMNWADDIAYSTHDLEDGLKSGMITYQKIINCEEKVKRELREKWDDTIWKEIIKDLELLFTHRQSDHALKAKRKEFVSNLVNEFIRTTRCEQVRNSSALPCRYHYKLVRDPKSHVKCKMLKIMVWETIISDERVATLESKGRHIVRSLFEQFTLDKNSPHKLLPSDFRIHLSSNNTSANYRIVCDYIAGMTDAYALRIYSRMAESDIHSVFDM